MEEIEEGDEMLVEDMATGNNEFKTGEIFDLEEYYVVQFDNLVLFLNKNNKYICLRRIIPGEGEQKRGQRRLQSREIRSNPRGKD